ncbi:MAG: CooT family nickel-binding protein [Candidatus Latescibacterota bacterium]
MCQSSVYATAGEGEELLLEDVALITVDGDRLELRTLFGEPLLLRGRIRQIDLMKHRIVLERR